MTSNLAEFYRSFGIYLLSFMGIALLLALFLLAIISRQVKKIEIPPNAGFGETLLHTPFLIVLFVDLLDFGLDILAAPIVWVFLDRWGLKALRNVSAIEALIPFTQAVPTLTISWVWVRLFGY